MENSMLMQPKSISGMPNEERDPMKLLVWTVADLQRAIGCGRRQAYEMANMAGFPAIRLNGGKKILIPRDAFLRWLDDQTAKAVQA